METQQAGTVDCSTRTGRLTDHGSDRHDRRNDETQAYLGSWLALRFRRESGTADDSMGRSTRRWGGS
jgi:hypothetical protein